MSAGTAYQVVSAAQVFTAAAVSTSTAGTEMHREVNIYMNFTAVTGTTPSVTPVVEISPDGGTTWYTRSTLTPVTAAGKVLTVISTNVGKLMRINYGTVTGTTPSFTVDCTIGGKRNLQ